MSLIDVRVDVDVDCNTCGAVLEAFITSRDNTITVSAVPCPTCLTEAEDDGFKNGCDTADDRHDLGCETGYEKGYKEGAEEYILDGGKL